MGPPNRRGHGTNLLHSTQIVHFTYLHQADSRVQSLLYSSVPFAELRRNLNVPNPPGTADYNLRNLNINDPVWFRDIPADRRTLIVAETLSCSLSKKQTQRMFRDVAEYFGRGGQIILSTVGSMVTKFRPMPIKKSSVDVRWTVDDARSEMEAWHPRLRLVGRIRWCDYLSNSTPLGQSAPPVFGPWK